MNDDFYQRYVPRLSCHYLYKKLWALDHNFDAQKKFDKVAEIQHFAWK